MVNINSSLSSLKNYIEKEEYKGWDPYDGLNSKFFQSIPLFKNSRFFRLAWIQFFKRSPINLRNLFKVEKGYNSKGIALFLASYCKLYQINNDTLYLDKIDFLANKLLSLQSQGWSGSCWGYNFDWQARAFFQPKNTPTVVASVYAANALLDAYEIIKNPKFLEVAISCCDFVLKDLNRTYDADGDFCFSYSPLDKTVVYNASLLGSRLLSRTFSFTGNQLYLSEAKKSINFSVKNQQPNGAWSYGQQTFHYWVDNFHTGFNLECIMAYQKFSGDKTFASSIDLGFNYYINTFFETDGKAKYYNNKVFPIDIHAPAQLVITLYELGKLQQHQDICNKVMNWTIKNMQSKKGYFYFQVGKNITSKIPYMRWAQAWMFFAFATLKKFEHEN